MNEPKQLHQVIPFPKGRRPKAEPNPFDGLAKKLEARIDRIENALKESMGLLESDIRTLIEKNREAARDGALKQDFDDLAKTLERRMQQALENVLQAQARPSKSARDEIKFFSGLTVPLAKVLSFDFLKGLFASLSEKPDEVEVDEFGMDPLMVERITPFCNFLYHKYWRVKTTGIENVPDEGRALVVANHSGTLPYDGAMLAAAIFNEHPVRHDARFLVENFVYHMPMLGTLMYRIGGVRACPENAERLLSAGHLVIVFPEGVKGIGKYYKDRYKLQRFGRGGFIKLCINTKSPLIPVGIVGAEEIHPILFKSNSLAKTVGVPYIPITPTFPLLGLLGMIPLPSKWSIHFGKPVHFDRLSAKTIEDEITIHKLSEQVRGDIQQILFDLLKKRRSAWFE